jgi:glutaredoxin
MTLYTKSNCPACSEAKAAIDNAGLQCREISTDDDEGHAEMLADAERLGVTPRAMPVLIAGDDLWTGYDCIVAVQEGEVKG